MMIRSGDKNNPVYDPASNAAYMETIILSTMYIVGMSENNLTSVTIDEIINKIRSTFEYSKTSIPTAGAEAVRGISMLLVLNLRRAWFDRQVALEVAGRG